MGINTKTYKIIFVQCKIFGRHFLRIIMKVFSLTRRLNALSTTQNIRKNFRNCETGQVYSEQRLVGYSCEQMFSVVSEVERYHSFVPWCKKSVIKKRKRRNGQIVAELIVGFPPHFGESYTSTVTLVEPYLVTAVCNDLNMFNHLKTVWKFSPIENEIAKCKLDFAVSFEFRNSVHNYISRLFFDEVIKKNVKAFLKQAENRYGRE